MHYVKPFFRIFFLVGTIFCFNKLVNAQSFPVICRAHLMEDARWTFQLPPVIEGTISGVTFIDEKSGWITATRSPDQLPLLLYTVDGGYEWSEIDIPFFAGKIKFISAQVGFTAARSKMYRSIDGGQNWSEGNMPLLSDINIKGIEVLSETKAWAIGRYDDNSMLLLHTQDGNSWQQVNFPLPYGTLYDVFFVDQLNGWAAGKDADGNCMVIHTIDGGQTWDLKTIVDSHGQFESVFFIDQLNGWASGGSGFSENDQLILYKTTDGGQTWTDISPETGTISQEVFFTDLQTGYLAIRSRTPEGWETQILESTDGGQNWNVKTDPIPGYFGSDMVWLAVSDDAGNRKPDVMFYLGLIVGTFSSCSIITEVLPTIEAGEVDPSVVSCLCMDPEKYNFVPTAYEGWEFIEFHGEVPMECPANGVELLKAQFGPYITIAGVQDTFYCCDRPNMDKKVLEFNMKPSEADTWKMVKLNLKVEGSGDDKEDIKEVRLYIDGEKIGTGEEFSTDDGTISYTFDEPVGIPLSGIKCTIYVDFNKINDCSSDKNEFFFTVSATKEDLFPANWKPGIIKNGASGKVFIGCIWNKELEIAYKSIQNAVEGAADGNTILVCPGDYFDNIDVNKTLKIQSLEGAEKTNVQAEDENDAIFKLLQREIEIDGFHITGSKKAGIEIHSNLCKVYRCHILLNKDGVAINDDTFGSTIGNIDNGGNWISGNTHAGILISNSDENSIEGNNIGTRKEGYWDYPNVYGIYIKESSRHNHIGYWNTISGNSECGILIEDSFDTRVFGNKIGITKDGSKMLPNKHGIWIRGLSEDNWIGNNTPEPQGNVISGNIETGIIIEGAVDNIIRGNIIGLSGDSNIKMPNNTGVHIHSHAQNNKISEGNIISGNKEYGIKIESLIAYPNEIYGNIIGTNRQNYIDLGNDTGINLTNGAQNNIVGGALEEKRNIISGNEKFGITILGSGTRLNKVLGNYIGIDSEGTKRLPNGFNGIFIGANATENYIGGFVEGEGNVISGNNSSGLLISTNQADQGNNLIIKNKIGTDPKGEISLENKSHGIEVYSSNMNKISGNLVSGNDRSGVYIKNANGNVLYGNFIGLTNSGLDKLPNKIHGIDINNSDKNLIGGKLSGRGNKIGGNKQNGINAFGCTGTEIFGNTIGTDLVGLETIPNHENGLEMVFCDKSKIGGLRSFAKNIISGNSKNGIVIKGGADNTVVGNHIGTGALGNEKMGQAIGIDLLLPYDCVITNNRIHHNCQGIVLDSILWKKGRPSLNTIANNNIKDSDCESSGIHLVACAPLITGNQISKDAGNAIFCSTGADPLIEKNNLFDNKGFGLKNEDPFIKIKAQYNWWGKESGPGDFDIEGNADYSNWAEAPFDLHMFVPVDTLYIPGGTKDSLDIYFKNWAYPMDLIDIQISDSLGWYSGSIPNSWPFTDSLGTSFPVFYEVPEIVEGSKEKIVISVISLIDPDWKVIDSFYIKVFEPSLSYIEIAPDTIVQLKLDDSLQYYAAGFDQIDHYYHTDIHWSTTGGIIDSTGMYWATEPGVFEVFASNLDSSVWAETEVWVSMTAVNDMSLKELDLKLYPNPFTDITQIDFNLEKRGKVRICLYDIFGREMSIICNTYFEAGSHSISFSADRLESGLYLCELNQGNHRKLVRMVVYGK